MEITKDFIRYKLITFLNDLTPLKAFKFLNNHVEDIIDLSDIKNALKQDLKCILDLLLKSENNQNLAQKIKENFMNIYNNNQDKLYEIILLKFLDILIMNGNKTLNLIEKLHFFKYLISFKNIRQKNIDKFYEFLDKSDLKTIFGKE